jgi:hypothetical protein
MTLRGKTVALFKLGFIALAIIYFSAFLTSNASATQITSRSLTLEQGAGGDGGSKPSGTVKHKFDFTIPSSTTLGSIKFQYCTTASGTCSAVSGLTTTGSVTLSNQSGLTGFSLDNTTNGSPFIHRTAAAPGGAPTPNGTNYKGQSLTGYDTAGTFKFTTSGDTIANSANGGAGPTDVQLYTASYIANVSGGQPIGTYTTTLTYICTATF